MKFIRNIFGKLWRGPKKLVGFIFRKKTIALGLLALVATSAVSYRVGSKRASANLKQSAISQATKSLEEQAKRAADKSKQQPVAATPSPTATNPSKSPIPKTSTTPKTTTARPTVPSSSQKNSQVAGVSTGQFRISGKVSTVSESGFVLDSSGGNILTILVNSHTLYMSKDGQKIGFDKITKDSTVSVQVRIETEGQFTGARVQIL